MQRQDCHCVIVFHLRLGVVSRVNMAVNRVACIELCLSSAIALCLLVSEMVCMIVQLCVLLCAMSQLWCNCHVLIL